MTIKIDVVSVNSTFNTISLEIMKRILHQLFHLYYNK